MANNSTYVILISSEVLLFSVIFKFIAMGIGVTGNIAVIIYNIFMLKEKTATSYLIANLALADLLVCLTFYPIWIVEFIQTILEIDSDQDLFCKISRSSIHALIFASVATLLAITIDCYLFIVKPLKYPMIVTRRRIILIILGIWLTASGVHFVQQLYGWKLRWGFRSACSIPDSIYYTMCCFIFYLPITSIFIYNFQILKVAREHRQRILPAETAFNHSNGQSAQKIKTSISQFYQALKAAKTFLVVVAVLVFCFFTPTLIGTLLVKICSVPCRQIWFVVFNFELYGINSIVNPFIYAARHIKYRKAYGNILFKFLRCKVFS